MRAIRIFDVYTGPQIPRGKKSIAVSLKFFSDDRTLTDEEVDTVVERIISELHLRSGISLRS